MPYSQNVNLTDYGAEAEDIARRRQMAQRLQERALEPIQQQTAGGYVLPISWTQGLAKMLQGGVGVMQERGLKDEAKTLSAKRNQALAEALGGMPTAQTSEVPGSQSDQMQFNIGPQTQTVQPTMQQNAAWLGKLGQIGPDAVSMGGTVLGMQQKHEENTANRDARTLDRIMQLEAAAQNAALSREERAARAAEAATLRREMQTSQQEFINNQNRLSAADRAALAAAARENRPPVQPQLRDTDQGLMQVDRSGIATPVIGPDGKPVLGKSTEKALPTSAAQKLMENNQNLRRAEQALALITGKDPSGDKNATGFKGYLPDVILQRADPSGIATRAAIADLGSLVIHDRSGAAVTASEFPRLQPFIPSARDDPATVKKKLEGFVREYKNVVGEASDFYRSSGYKVPSETLRNAGASDSWAVVK